MTRVLLVEDEVRLGEALAEGLTRAQYTVDLALDGEDGLAYARTTTYDVIVLDVMLPKIDGFEVCRRLRADRCSDAHPDADRPRRRSGPDRRPGLGGRRLPGQAVRARRAARSDQGAAAPRLGHDGGDPARRRSRPSSRLPSACSGPDSPIDLTAREYRVLEGLMRRPGWIVSRESLIESVWGFDFADTSDTSNLVEVYVGRVRRKLAEHGAPQLIQTVRGAGYRLREPGP